MTRVLAIAQRIVRQFRHDKRTLGLLFVVPIVIVSLLGPLLTNEAEFKVGVVQEDEGVAPKGLPGARAIIASDQLIKLLENDDRISVVRLAREEVPSTIKKGEAVVALVFPSDFTEKGVRGEKASLQVVVDGSNPGRAQAALAALQKTISSESGAESKLGMDIDYQYGGESFNTLDYFAPAFIAFFAFFFVFLLTSVSFLRERGQGTIERLMSSPASRLEIILGYQLGFILFATIQVAIIVVYTIYALDVRYVGNIGAIFFIEFLLTLVGVNMGIFFSSFAANELQVIQFIPVVITPQGLLSGIVLPIEDMPKYFQWIAQVMPLTHANNALKAIMIRGYSLSEVSFEVGFLVVFAFLMVVLSALTIRRQVA
ncbi:MAG: ABC transporter permease [Candidatus Aquicultorales bacterium]